MTVPANLQWLNERPDGTDAAVLKDIASSLASLAAPENLHYHTVFLGVEDNAPGVIVSGEVGNPNFICEYFTDISEAFVSLTPNASDITSILDRHGIETLEEEDIELFGILRDADQNKLNALLQIVEACGPDDDTETLKGLLAKGRDRGNGALKVFLEGRGGKKAQPTDDDHLLGENAIANRNAENEQDKGA